MGPEFYRGVTIMGRLKQRHQFYVFFNGARELSVVRQQRCVQLFRQNNEWRVIRRHIVSQCPDIVRHVYAGISF